MLFERLLTTSPCLAACAVSIALSACGQPSTASNAPPQSSLGAGGTSAAAPAGAAPSAVGGTGAMQQTTPPPPAAGTPGTAPVGAAVAGSGAAPVAGMAALPTDHDHAHTGSAGAASGAGGMMAMAESACKLHATLDPRDAMVTDTPQTISVGAQKDLLMPQLVLDWMDENQFAEAHDGWHLVRKWDQTCRMSNATTCAAASRLTSQGLERAPIQQGAPGDGIAFMMMHRHMIHMLNTAFPSHAKLFAGFTKVPRTTSDPENPQPSRAISWTADNKKGFDTLEDIEHHLDQFPTEDDLGQYIENTYRWTAQTPMSPVNAPGSGLHGALHSQWSVNGSPANLIQQAVDVKNYQFWKLHGWIDNIWERYRKAKGLKDDDPAYQKLWMDQCMEMFLLEPRNRNMPNPGSTGSNPGTTTQPETGVFATMIRPVLDSTCAGCHSPIAPSAGMTLGGMGVSSAEVMAGIVSQKASNGEYNLIEPGAPEKSWLYLKASGDVANVTCTQACIRQTMPPSGMSLTAAQLSTLRQWIMDGATNK